MINHQITGGTMRKTPILTVCLALAAGYLLATALNRPSAGQPPAIEPLPEATLAPFMTARDAPRVAFSELIERGMIMPGAKLVDAKGRHGALVRADGAIMLGDKVGSIHRIGAVAQGAEACNGWTFWHVETKDGLRLIDELRAQIRAGQVSRF